VRQRRIDLNGTSSILSAIILGTIGVLSFIVQPGLVQGFVSELGLDEIAANDLAFVEMLGVAIATYLVAYINNKVDWRVIVAASLVLAAIGNFASALISDPALFQVARFLTGFGEGGVISLSFTIIGLTVKTERNLALYLVLLLTYGALGLWAMPVAFDTIGLKGIFVVWGVLTLCALITTRYLPESAEGRVEVSPTAAQVSRFMLVVALLAVLVYNMAVGIAWANLFLIGIEIQNDEQAIANALLAAQFVAIFGALIPVFMEARFGRWMPTIVGIFGGAAFIALLLDEPTYSVFLISVCGFNFLWNFFMPFMLSAVGDMVTKGEIISVAVAMQMTGLGAGPFVAARIMESGGGHTAIELTTIGMMIVSFILLAISKFARRKALALTNSK
jgi:MFS family permease